MKTDDFQDQKLISLQTRGGLAALTSDAQLIFIITEEKFRANTISFDIRKIDTKLMVRELMKNTDVISVYNKIIQLIEIDEESKLTLLMKMISL